ARQGGTREGALSVARAMGRADWRVLPLAALVAVLALAVLGKVVRRRGAAGVAAVPGASLSASAASMAPSARAAPVADGLGGGAPERGGRVTGRGARTLHGDARRPHRAGGQVPREVKLAWSYATAGAVQAQVTVSPDEQTLYVASLDG